MKTLFCRRGSLALTALALTFSLHAAPTIATPVGTPSPGYPAVLTDTGTSGTATIDVVVRTDGTVGDAKVKSGDNDAFGEAALSAVKKWRFEPATMKGAPAGDSHDRSGSL